jgi:hypothetical protein
MADKTTQRAKYLLTMYKAALFDFPLAGATWGLVMGQEKKIVEATWKGYDAWVRLASTSIDDLYSSPLFGEVLARSLDRWLRWQRLNQVTVGTFFAALWPAVGLPTAEAVQALHEEISSLDIRLQAQDATTQTLRGDLRALQTLREEFRAALPAQRNGNGAGPYTA